MSFDYYNQGKRIKLDIVEYVTTRPKKGRRSHPAIPSGTKVYLIQYETGGYYTYCYLNRIDAEKCIENSKLYYTDNEYYREWNVTLDADKTLHY